LRRPSLASAIAGAAVLLASSAAGRAEPARWISGTIQKFECGDNCYLTLRTKSGTTTALCEAKACRPWFENQKIPQKLIGRHVKATVGVGKQVDGNYDVVGTFASFKSLVFVK
jgi:hypothetical protein